MTNNRNQRREWLPGLGMFSVVMSVAMPVVVSANFGCSSSSGPGGSTGGTSGGISGSGGSRGSSSGGNTGGAASYGTGGVRSTGGGPANGGSFGTGASSDGGLDAATGTGGVSGTAGAASSTGGGTGSGASGGQTGTAGVPGSSGGTGGAVAGYASAAALGGLGGSADRPMLTNAQAGLFTVAKYLARAGSVTALVTDNWDPTGGVVTPATPTYAVSAGGAMPTVQGAITAAVSAGGKNRVYIQVSPGTYNEVVCVPKNAPPITLYGTGADPTATVIQFNNWNGKAVDGSSPTNPCTGTTTDKNKNKIYGTNGSATFAAFANGFQAKNLTFANSVTTADFGSSTSTQAVALMTEADQIVLDNVRVLGHQDTLYVETPNAATVVRVYIKGSYIAGDVDFIFGGATAVVDNCTVQFVSDRQASGQILAPDTDSRNPYGILVNNSQLTADSATKAGAVGLGRTWDHNCSSDYVTNCLLADPNGYPNGQATVRDSVLGTHIDTAVPWKAAATTKRAYSSTPVPDCGGTTTTCPANRLYEFQNSR
jgi:pectinesterase